MKVPFQNSTYITFSWKELKCHQQNGPITGYQYHTYHDLFMLQYDEGIVDSTTSTLTLFDTAVQAFSVAAVNEAGVGEHSPALKLTLPYMGKKDYYAEYSCE